MFRNSTPPTQGGLSPERTLELANVCLENARKAKDPELALELCDLAGEALSRLKHNARAIASFTDTQDHASRERISTTYLEIGKLQDDLQQHEKAQASYKRAEKWGQTHHGGLIQRPGSPFRSSRHGSRLRLAQSKSNSGSMVALGSLPTPPPTHHGSDCDVATVPSHIFTENTSPPAIVSSLPESGAHLNDTPQLACCLGLLQASPSPDDILEQATRDWIQETEQDTDEQERLKTLAIDVIREFLRDELKDDKAVAEVVCLAPVLEKDAYRDLLRQFYMGIDQSSLLDLHQLEGLARMIQGASPGYLDADDLVKTLELLGTRLKDTHQQSTYYIYQLTLAISHVLDAMADSKVRGLDREKLHEPLSSYLDRLKGSDDPYLVYQSAYAFQALLYVPDNETPWQATLRRTGKVIQGLSGLVSAVKGFDLNAFVEGLSDIQQGLAGASQVVDAVKTAYSGVASLAESGKDFLDCLKEGLSFDRKRTWYQALRGADTLIQEGQFAKLRRLICEVPCRNDPAFQWGLCQRLGDIAANHMWNMEVRQSAVGFLGEIYRNDDVWGHHANIKQCVLNILMQLTSPSGTGLHCAEMMLDELEADGDLVKQALYHTCQEEGPSSHPLKSATPSLASPSLIDRAQSKPDVEGTLRQLKRLRLSEHDIAVYIPPQAKAGLQTPDDALFPLMDKVKEFLGSDRKVLLLMGDSGAGKSTFNRALECDLWQAYKSKTGAIPLHINLPAIDKPDHDMIAKQLLKADFTQPQIRELKESRQFILICDGYDESQQTRNLYLSNRLNQPGEWKAKMIVSCRSESIGRDYRDRFQPIDHSRRSQPWLFQEAVFTPFSPSQIRDYIKQYVSIHRPLWETENYLQALDLMPSLRELVRNPFLLTLSLEVLPRMVDPGPQLSATRITRVALYDQFVEQWLERGKRRIGEKDLTHQERGAFDSLSDEGFTQNGIDFLKKLATAIFREQYGQPVIEYSRFRDEGTWKATFFGQDDEKRLLREASPLTRSGNQYRFIHRSLLEYGLARAVYDPEDGKKKPAPEPVSSRRHSTSSLMSFEIFSDLDHKNPTVIEQELENTSPLFWRSFVNEPSILQFLQDRVQQEPLFKQQLFTVLEQSKTDKTRRTAAANAITILVRSGVQFNGYNLQGIKIPGADLSLGVFDSAQLQNADLRKVDLRNAWLRQADLRMAKMAGVQFGELPFLTEESKINTCAYSPDGKSLAIGLHTGDISIYATSCWEKGVLSGHSDQIACVTYSPSSEQIASGSYDSTVRLWDMETGDCQHTLVGHTDWVMSIMYSPTEELLASGSNDCTLRLWDTRTGHCRHILSGHGSVIASIVFSPRGDQIVSGSWDMTVRFWDTETGTCRHELSGHQGDILSVAYSPKGSQIATGSGDKTARLWDVESGKCSHTLSGHSEDVWTVVYSPKGDQVASGSCDTTVRIWDVETGACLHTLQGHTGAIPSVAFSPTGNQIVSCSDDRTVRLWSVENGDCRRTFSSHSDRVTMVVYSPKGNLVASASDDKTVRLWDMEAEDFSQAFSADIEGNQVANGNGKSSGWLWDKEAAGPTGVMYVPTHDITSIVFSPKGGQIAASSDDYTVRLVDMETGTCRHTLNHTRGVVSVAYSAKGCQIASASGDFTAKLWDTETGMCLHTLGDHSGAVNSVAYSLEGDLVATGSEDKTVRVWDTKTGVSRHVLDTKSKGVNTVLYSPKGDQIASSCWSGLIQLWDVETGACRHTLREHSRHVLSLVYSPDGTMIASGSSDSTICLWDTETGDCLHRLTGHDRGVLSVVFSPQGNQVVSGSEDMTVRLWNPGTGACQCILRGHTDKVSKVVYSPKGNLIASASDDMKVQLWDVESGLCQAVVHTFQRHIQSISWTTNLDVNYLATGCGDGSVRLWRVVEGKDQCRVYLCWSTMHKALAVADMSIWDATGLSQMNRQLLRQHGAVGEASLD